MIEPAEPELNSESEAQDDFAVQARRMSFAVLLGVACLAIVGVVVSAVAISAREANQAWLEILKSCLQVLAAVLIGAFVGYAVYRLQQVQRRQSALDSERREDRRIADRNRSQTRLDARRRLDELTTSFLKETITAYHGVKQVRRMLEIAGPRSAPTAKNPAEEHLRLMTELSLHQLTFEGLRRRALLLQNR